jgi:FkbM family methyltransferase
MVLCKLSCAEALDVISAASPARLPERDTQPLYIYGNGKLGTLARDFFAAVSEPVAGIFEHGERPDTAAQVAVAIVTSPYMPIKQKLHDAGFSNVVPFYDLAQTLRGHHPLSNGWIAPPLTDKDREAISRVWQTWEDDVSRAHYLQFLAWRTIRQEWSFADIPAPCMDDQHFIPEIVSVLGDHETFLDGGAYHGEAAQKFAMLVKGKFDRIYAYEPDMPNYLDLCRSAFADRMFTMNYALAEADGVARFAAGFGYCSKLSPEGNRDVMGRSIDSLGKEPTFIKLHLEGGEFNALKGARETLLKCRPIVAANVDHNTDGLWRTAVYLMDCLDSYQFLFRNHVWCAAGSVIYAIPNERYGK